MYREAVRSNRKAEVRALLDRESELAPEVNEGLATEKRIRGFSLRD